MSMSACNRVFTNGDVVISFKAIYQQIFDFPFDIIKFILANANYNVVKKLYFTSKYFPAKYRLYLMDNLDFRIFMRNSEDEIATNSDCSFKDKIWVGKEISMSPLSISWWTSKVVKCTIKRLENLDADLSWNEFKILAEARTIAELEILNIMDSDGQIVAVEDICAYTPQLNYFVSLNTHITPTSIKNLCNSLKTDMEQFDIENIDDLLNVEDYLEFIKKRPKAYFQVSFSLNVSKDRKEEFIAAVESEIQRWPEPKPQFCGLSC